jgi:hypothetical protein
VVVFVLGLATAPVALAGWAVQPVPAPPLASGQLTAVSWASREHCVAVGSFTDRVLSSATLGEIWNGSRWRITTPTNAAAVPGELAGVSCVSRTACTAVGSSFPPFEVLPLIERWNGSVWTIQTEPSVSGPS